MTRKLLLLFSAFLFVSVVQAQSDAAVMLTLDGAEAVSGTSSSGTDNSFIATLSTGENIVANVIQIANGDNIVNIKKISAAGTVSTLKNLVLPSGSVTSTNLKGLTCSASGAFTVLFGEVGELYIAKFSNTGSVVFQKQVLVPGITSTYYNHSLDETPTGQYYITLSAFEFTAIVKLDSYGDLEWSKRIAGPKDDGKCPGFCTEVTSSGGCITTLKDESYETIIQMGADGSLIWSRSFVDFSYRWPKSIKADNLGNFYVMGTFGSAGATFVQKLDANGNFIYAKTFSTTTVYQDAYVNSSNKLVLMSIHPTLRLTQMGDAGNVLWSKGVGGLAAGNIYSTATAFSESVGTSMSFLSWLNDSTSVAFKTPEDLSGLCNTFNHVIENTENDAQILNAEIDSACNISPLTATVSTTTFTTSSTEYYVFQDFCSFIASVEETTAADLNIYPNPATDYINIDLSKMNQDNAVLVVYDMTGRKVFEKQLNSSSIEMISTADYAAGLYTVVISNTKKVLAKQRVVVQK